MIESKFISSHSKKKKKLDLVICLTSHYFLSFFFFLLLGSCTVSPSSVITHERGNYALLPFCCGLALCPLCSGPEPSTCPIRNQPTSSLSCSPSDPAVGPFSNPSRSSLSSISTCFSTVSLTALFHPHSASAGAGVRDACRPLHSFLLIKDSALSNQNLFWT